jgi:hypothetical protein
MNGWYNASKIIMDEYIKEIIALVSVTSAVLRRQ